MCCPLLRIATVSLIFCLVAQGCLADDDLFRRVRNNHKAARESIQSLTASVKRERTHPKKGTVAEGRYWRSGNTARIQMGQEGKHLEDAQMNKGEIRTIGRTWAPGKQSSSANASRKPGDTLFSPCDVWREMLIELSGPSGMQLELDRMLETADGPVRATEEDLDGRACIRLKYILTYGNTANGQFTKTEVNQWHDPARNYLISKLVVEYPNDSSQRDIVNVSDFIEPSPGVIFPTRVTRQHFKKGEMYQASQTTLTDVVINKPIPAATMALPNIPRGTILVDHIDNREGPIDSDWKPIGKMTPLGPRPVPAAERAPSARVDPPTETTPSTDEPSSSARWVIIGSVSVLLVAAAFALVRRIRTGRRPVTEAAP